MSENRTYVTGSTQTFAGYNERYVSSSTTPLAPGVGMNALTGGGFAGDVLEG